LTCHFVQVAPKRVLDCRVVMGDWLAVVLHCFAAFDCLCVQLLVRFALVSWLICWLLALLTTLSIDCLSTWVAVLMHGS